MDKKKLAKRLIELNEHLTNLNNSKHNYSFQLEMYARDLFEKILDEIAN
jgi:antirestriction protein